MDETNPLSDIESQVPEPADDSEKAFLRSAATKAAKLIAGKGRKAAAVVTAVSVAGGVPVAIELNQHTNPRVVADVPYQAYGKDGHQKPELHTNGARDPIIEGITPVYSNNPYENAQQLLWLAANNNPHKSGVVMLHMQPGVMEVSGVTLYHAPLGSEHFIPFNPHNDGQADKLVVPSGEVAVIKDQVTLTTYADEPEWILVSLASDTSTIGRATDIKQVYWLSKDEADQKGAKYFAYKGFPSTVVDASVNEKGNFQPSVAQTNQPSETLSTIEIIKDSEINKENEKLGLVPDSSTVPPPPIAGN